MELVIQEIKKNFGEKKVLKGISFRAVGGKAFGRLVVMAPEKRRQSVY